MFGNLIATATFAEATDQLINVSELHLDQSAAAWPVFRTDPAVHSFPFTYSPDDAAALGTQCLSE